MNRSINESHQTSKDSSRVSAPPVDMTHINPNNLRASLPISIRNNKGVKALNENDQLRILEFVDVESGVVYKEDNRTITSPED